MNVLIRQATIIDPSSPFHLQQVDLFIKEGIIAGIDSSLTGSADPIINIPGLYISPGWLDPFAHFCDPGLEMKETMETGANAAAAGGYTDVMVLPNTVPALHSKASIEYVIQKSTSLPVSLYPIAAVTKNTEGKELAEMYDMHSSGAVAYSDGTSTIQSSGILLKALQYVKAIDKTIIQIPEDGSISNTGLMHEGIISTQLGLPGKPAIAEEIMIARDLELTKYTGSKIHFTGVSTGKSITLIRKAKEEGIAVTCSVTPYHLAFCDEDLAQYDTNLKVTPPVRTREDKTALQNAVLDGTVDCIASHHLPQERDSKMVEFEYAQNGMIGLQTCFAGVRSNIPQLSSERLVELFSTNARKIFGLHLPGINRKEKATLTLFLPDKEWVLINDLIYSKSKNSPFLGMRLTGKPVGIINKGSLFLAQ